MINLDSINNIKACDECDDCKKAIIAHLKKSVSLDDLKKLTCDVILEKIGLGNNFKALGMFLIVVGLLLLTGVYFLKAKVMLLFTILIIMCSAIVGLGGYIFVKEKKACDKLNELRS